MSQLRMIFTSVGSQDDAQRIAHALVESADAACVNVIPGVQSVYWWEGEVQSEHEWLLVIKTTDDCVDAAVERLRDIHPYDVPEVVVLQPSRVTPEYERWATNATTRFAGGDG